MFPPDNNEGEDEKKKKKKDKKKDKEKKDKKDKKEKKKERQEEFINNEDDFILSESNKPSISEELLEMDFENDNQEIEVDEPQVTSFDYKHVEDFTPPRQSDNLNFESKSMGV